MISPLNGTPSIWLSWRPEGVRDGRRKLLQEMGFEEAHSGWNEGRLMQSEVGQLPGICERCFRLSDKV